MGRCRDVYKRQAIEVGVLPLGSLDALGAELKEASPGLYLKELGRGREEAYVFILYAQMDREQVQEDVYKRQVLDVLQELGGRSGEFQLEPADLLKWRQAQAEPSLELIFDWPADGELWSQLLGYSQALTFNRPIKRMLLQLQPEPALLLSLIHI